MAASIYGITPQSKFIINSQLISDVIHETENKTMLPLAQLSILRDIEKYIVKPNVENDVSLLTPSAYEGFELTSTPKYGTLCIVPYLLKANRVLVIAPSLNHVKSVCQSFFGNVNHVPFLQSCSIITDQKEHRRAVLENPCPVHHVNDLEKNKLDIQGSNLVVINAQIYKPQSNAKITDFDPEEFDLVIIDEAGQLPRTLQENIKMHFINSTKFYIETADINKDYTLGTF